MRGGTQDESSCDPDSLFAGLESEPEKTAASASVFDLPTSEIRAYIDGLIPVVLTRNTRVTNHGSRNGWWYVYGTADAQTGESIPYDVSCDPISGRFTGDDPASADAIEGTACD